MACLYIRIYCHQYMECMVAEPTAAGMRYSYVAGASTHSFRVLRGMPSIAASTEERKLDVLWMVEPPRMTLVLVFLVLN